MAEELICPSGKAIAVVLLNGFALPAKLPAKHIYLHPYIVSITFIREVVFLFTCLFVFLVMGSSYFGDY